MRPWLLQNAYSLAVLTAAALAAGVALRSGRRLALPSTATRILISMTLVAAVAGARWIPVHGHLPVYGELSVLGALIGGTLALAVGGWSLGLGARTFDLLFPAAPLAMAIGRVGCFFAGCCYGTPTLLPWGVQYEAGTSAFAFFDSRGAIAQGAGITAPLHPVQLYESLADLVLLGLVLRIPLRSIAARPLAFGALYACARFGLEFLRARGELVGGLKLVQWALAAVALVLLAALVWRERATLRSALPRPLAHALPSTLLPFLCVPLALGVFVWGTALEQLLAGAALLLLGTVILQSHVTTRRGFSLATVGAFLIAPQDPAVPIDSTFPRTWVVVGGSVDLGGFKTESRDCEGNVLSTQPHGFLAGAASVGLQHQRSPDVGVGVTAAVAAGAVESGRERNVDGSGFLTTPSGTFPFTDLQLVTNLDGRLLGATLGVATPGPMALFHPLEAVHEGLIPVAGLRLGRLSRTFVEGQIGDINTPGLLVTPLRLGVGFATDSAGSRRHIGLMLPGLYLRELRVRTSGREIEWTAQVSPRYVGTRIAVRQRMPVRARGTRDSIAP